MKFTVNLDSDGHIVKIHDGNPKNECNSKKTTMKDAETWTVRELLVSAAVGLGSDPPLCVHCFGGDE